MLSLLRAITALAFVRLVVAGVSERRYSGIPNTFPSLLSCSSQVPVFSCENASLIQNTCCSPTPGGLVLATQFWDTHTGLEEQGQKLPKGSWTIHGLWPDNCDGSFQQYCDFSRQYDPAPSPATLSDGTIIPPWEGPGVDTFIKDFGLNKFWINQGAPNAAFWAHEFSKHATCTSTFDVKCYGPDYKEHEEVINFFDAAIRAFHRYPSFDILAASGIVPSNKTSYTLQQITTAINTQIGVTPFIGCSHNGTVLSELWYFHHVLGTEQYGSFKPLDSTSPSTCSQTAPIWYFERTPSSEQEVRA